MRLARNQILLERGRNKKLRRLLKEIIEYGKLKEQWGIGHITIVQCRCNSRIFSYVEICLFFSFLYNMVNYIDIEQS